MAFYSKPSGFYYMSSTEGPYNIWRMWDILQAAGYTVVAVQIPTGQVAANLGNFDNALLAGAVAGAADLTSTFKESVNAASGVGGGGTYGGGGGRR